MSEENTNTETSTTSTASVSTGVPTTGNETITTNTATPDFSTMIPEAYREKEYLKGVDSMDRLFQDFDNAQKLIGKKSIPGPDDAPEKWDEFYKAAGRPDTASEYEFSQTEGLNYNEDVANKTKEIFHKAGLSAKQAAMIQQEYDKMVMEMQPSQEKIDQEFDALATEVFGAQKDQVLEKSKSMLTKYAPEKFKDHINNLSNENLIVLSSVLNGVINDHVSEDRIPSGGASNTGSDPREEAKKLMMSPEYKDAFHPNHEVTKKRVRELYRSLN